MFQLNEIKLQTPTTVTIKTSKMVATVLNDIETEEMANLGRSGMRKRGRRWGENRVLEKGDGDRVCIYGEQEQGAEYRILCFCASLSVSRFRARARVCVHKIVMGGHYEGDKMPLY